MSVVVSGTVLLCSDLTVGVCQIWKRDTLECSQVLQGHSGSVLCLQYDHNVIVSGSSDATVRSVHRHMIISFCLLWVSSCFFIIT